MTRGGLQGLWCWLQGQPRGHLRSNLRETRFGHLFLYKTEITHTHTHTPDFLLVRIHVHQDTHNFFLGYTPGMQIVFWGYTLDTQPMHARAHTQQTG